VDLTMRYVDDVKSSKLARVLTAIMEKLVQATEGMAERLVRTVGRELARKASDVAVGWGYCSAWAWACDSGFARYLAVNMGGAFVWWKLRKREILEGLTINALPNLLWWLVSRRIMKRKR